MITQSIETELREEIERLKAALEVSILTNVTILNDKMELWNKYRNLLALKAELVDALMETVTEHLCPESREIDCHCVDAARTMLAKAKS